MFNLPDRSYLKLTLNSLVVSCSNLFNPAREPLINLAAAKGCWSKKIRAAYNQAIYRQF
ncbi:MAG: hypothetical protein AAFO85_14900 [Cyanobacteria bacterium J06598_4]